MSSLSLRSYQEEDAEWLAGRSASYLAADPGLGKTATVLASLRPEHLPAVVVAPAHVAQHTWPTEVRKWRPDLKVRWLRSGDQLEGRDGSVADVYTVSYNVLHKIAWPRMSWPSWPRTLVVDESQYIKNGRATRSKACRQLAKRVERRIMLSGTPFGSSLADIHHQLLCLDGGATLGRSLGQFRVAYMFPAQRDPRTGMVWRWEPKPGAQDRVISRLGDMMRVRRCEDYLDLPDRVFVNHEVRLSPAEARAYRTLQKDFVLELAGGKEIAALTGAAVTMKLRQACAGFLLDEDGEANALGRGKQEQIRAVIEDVCGGPELDGGRPLVVWTQFRAEQEAILSAYPRWSGGSDRLGEWLDGQFPLLVTHPASLGAGVNLQTGGCHHELVTSLPWSLEQWVQSQARLRRSGQQETVVTHVLEARLPAGPGRTEPTVDAAVWRSLSEKRALLEALREELHV